MTQTLATAARAVRTELDGLERLHEQLSDDRSPLAAALAAAVDLIARTPGRVVVTGMGKSGHVARKIASTFASTGQPAAFVHPGEASHGDLGMIGDQDAILALSNSGETPELSDILAYSGRFDVPLIAITSRADSALGRAARVLLKLPEAEEACTETRAPTTSTTMSMVLGDAIAVALLTERGFTRDDFGRFHPGGKLGAALKRVEHMMHEGRELPLVSLGTPLLDAVETLSAGGFGCVGVMEEDALVGIVTDGDLRRRAREGLGGLAVDQVMTRGPKTVTPRTLAAEALGILSRTKITALFVVDGDRPVGLIHIHDVLDEGVL